MAIGRRELGAILLGVAAIVFYLVLLSTTPSGAQTGGGTNGTTSQNGDDGDCPGAELVDEFTGNGNQTTDEFEIFGDSFLISFETANSSNIDGFLGIFANDDQGNLTGSASQEGPGSGESFVNEGPGLFSLEITAANVEYAITVEDCTGGGTITTPATNLQPPAPRTTNQGGRTVINVPNKPLPPSGGLPVYGVVAGCVLAGAGLLALGLGIRRGPQG